MSKDQKWINKLLVKQVKELLKTSLVVEINCKEDKTIITIVDREK